DIVETVPIAKAAQRVEAELFPAEHDVPQMSGECFLRRSALRFGEVVEGGRRLVQYRDPVFPDEREERLRVADLARAGKNEAASVEQRAEDFPDGEVEAIGMGADPDVALVEGE